jgi:Family of unknown function (DUF6941)
MTEDVAQVSDPLQDRAQVRIFTLADYVAEESSGKLYISGAGLEWTEVVTRPDPNGTHHLLSFSLIIRVAIPRAIVRSTHAVEVFVFDRDGAPLGPDSLIKADMHFDLKRVPHDFTEVSGNLPAQIMNFPVDAGPEDVIFLHLLVDDVLVSRLPVQLRPADS